MIVIGGLSHQEVSEVCKFERDQITNGEWRRERIVLGSIMLKNQKATSNAVVTGNELLEQLASLNLEKDLNVHRRSDVIRAQESDEQNEIELDEVELENVSLSSEEEKEEVSARKREHNKIM